MPSTSLDPAELLPHRPPFLLLDTIDELVPGERVVARRRVAADDPVLAGHFPSNPVFPGVLQLEALAQAGACAVLADPRFVGRLPLFGGAERVRFKRIVRPGDELVLTVAIEQMSARGGWGAGEARVDGELACRARLLTVLS